MTKPILPGLETGVLRDNPTTRTMPTNQREWSRFLRQLSSPEIRSFTPSWTGFSVDPSGDMYYVSIWGTAIMWTSADRTGTSDAVTFTMGSLPSAIAPGNNLDIYVTAMDNAIEIPAIARIAPGGSISFAVQSSSGSIVQHAFNGWTATGTKGLLEETVFIYPLMTHYT